MHILILPMYYPEKDSSPHRGYMFFEQAMQLAKSGCLHGAKTSEELHMETVPQRESFSDIGRR